MANKPIEQYTIRAKVFDIVPQFFILDDQGQPTGYCRQKLFKFKEELIVYTDRSKETELLRIKARNIIDFAATYDVKMPDGAIIGSLRRKGIKSTFMRDEYLVFDADSNQVATLQEDSTWRALMRRSIGYAAMLMPQKFIMRDTAGQEVAIFRQHFNPIVLRIGIAVLKDDEVLDDLMLIATGLLAAAIEGRQR